MSEKLNFGVSDLVRHRALYQRCLGIIIEIRPTFDAAHVLWGGERFTWDFLSSLALVQPAQDCGITRQ
jgi:hypothetical protein